MKENEIEFRDDEKIIADLFRTKVVLPIDAYIQKLSEYSDDLPIEVTLPSWELGDFDEDGGPPPDKFEHTFTVKSFRRWLEGVKSDYSPEKFREIADQWGGYSPDAYKRFVEHGVDQYSSLPSRRDFQAHKWDIEWTVGGFAE